MPRPDHHDKGIIGSISLAFSFPESQADLVFRNLKALPIQGTPVTIRILEATDLKNTEMIGSVDPFATLTCGRVVKKTLVLDDTVKPMWRFSTKILWHESLPVDVCVHNFERMSSDDFLGRITVTQKEARVLNGEKKAFELCPRDRNDRNISGSITLQFLFEGMVGGDEENQKPTCIFGRSLEDIYQESGSLVPFFVIDSIRFLRKNGIDRPGGEDLIANIFFVF